MSDIVLKIGIISVLLWSAGVGVYAVWEIIGALRDAFRKPTKVNE